MPDGYTRVLVYETSADKLRLVHEYRTPTDQLFGQFLTISTAVSECESDEHLDHEHNKRLLEWPMIQLAKLRTVYQLYRPLYAKASRRQNRD